MVGYAVASAGQSTETVDGLAGAKEQLKALKNNWMRATHLDKVMGTDEAEADEAAAEPAASAPEQPAEQPAEQTAETVGAIGNASDLSELNVIESKVEESAINQETKKLKAETPKRKTFSDLLNDEGGGKQTEESFYGGYESAYDDPQNARGVEGVPDVFDPILMATI